MRGSKKNSISPHQRHVFFQHLQTFLIPDLHYDGLGPDAYFRVGPGPEPDASVKNPPGQKIPNELGRFVILLFPTKPVRFFKASH